MDQLMEWTFNPPWWVLALAGAAAVAFLVWAVPRREKRLTQAAIASLGVVALWAVLSWMITTPVEEARGRTIALVRAYEQADWERMDQLIDEETRFDTLFRGPQITRAAQMSHENYRPRNIRVLRIEPRRDELGIVVDIRLLAEMDTLYARTTTTAWRFDYRKRGDAWRLERIEPLATETTDLPMLLRQMPIPPELRE